MQAFQTSVVALTMAFLMQGCGADLPTGTSVGDENQDPALESPEGLPEKPSDTDDEGGVGPADGIDEVDEHVLVGEPTAAELATFDETMDWFEDVLAQTGVPGLQVAVVTRGKVRLAGAVGVRDLSTGAAMTDETLLRYGSSGKMQVAAAMQLAADQGLLELDDPVTDYVPDLQVPQGVEAETITIRHLLSHQAGLPDEVAFVCDTSDQGLADRFAQPVASWSPPGRLFNYSNLGYSLAGRVLEVATDRPFADAMEEMVFAPLGMEATYRVSEAQGQQSARSYILFGTEVFEDLGPATVEDCAWGRPAGTALSTASDVARFAAMMVQDGASLLSAERVQEMLTAQTPEGNGRSYGLGVTTWPDAWDGHRIVEHGGYYPAFSTSVLLLPDAEFAVVAIMNAGGAQVSAEDFTFSVASVLLGLDFDDLGGSEVLPAGEELERYAGTFQDPWELGEVIVTKDESGDADLLISFPDLDVGPGSSPRQAFAYGGDAFFIDDPTYAVPTDLTFWLDDDGEAEYIATRFGVGARVEP